MSSSARGSGGRPLIIELIGTPGAGKTTLARQLVEELREKGSEASTVIEAARPHAARTRLGRAIDRLPDRIRRPLLWQLFYALGAVEGVVFAFEHHALARRVVWTQLTRSDQAATRRHALYWYLQLAGRHRLLVATSNDGESILFDDGFLHRVVALFASHTEEPNPKEVAAYVDLVPQPDALIHVVAPRGVCERRVRARGVWRHSLRLSGGELSRAIENAEKVVEAAVFRAKELGWTVVEIENGDDLVDLTERRLAASFSPIASGAAARTRASSH
jgi:AAA domain